MAALHLHYVLTGGGEDLKMGSNELAWKNKNYLNVKSLGLKNNMNMYIDRV